MHCLPEPHRGRGRPRIYGDRYSAERVALLAEHRRRLYLYGKHQWVRYRSAMCRARFLKGQMIRAVWMQFETEDGTLSTFRLLLSTDPAVGAEQIISAYARRWSVEDVFNQLKNRWGWREAWQQSRQVLHRWTQILTVAYALPQLLAVYCSAQVQPLLGLTPWRKQDRVKAGLVRLGLQLIFSNVAVRSWWNPKWRKFQPPYQAIEDENRRKPPDGVVSKNKITTNWSSTVSRTAEL